jgi:hypothetical protein
MTVRELKGIMLFGVMAIAAIVFLAGPVRADTEYTTLEISCTRSVIEAYEPIGKIGEMNVLRIRSCVHEFQIQELERRVKLLVEAR